MTVRTRSLMASGATRLPSVRTGKRRGKTPRTRRSSLPPAHSSAALREIPRPEPHAPERRPILRPAGVPARRSKNPQPRPYAPDYHQPPPTKRVAPAARLSHRKRNETPVRHANHASSHPIPQQIGGPFPNAIRLGRGARARTAPADCRAGPSHPRAGPRDTPAPSRARNCTGRLPGQALPRPSKAPPRYVSARDRPAA